MSEFYKGKIILKKDIKFKKMKFLIDENNIVSILKPTYSLSGAEGRVLYESFCKFKNNKDFKIEDSISNCIINRITYKFFEINKKVINIIYEKVVDEEGFWYAKEVYTGYIFPLLEFNYCDLEYNVTYQNQSNKNEQVIDNTNGYILTNIKSRNIYDTCNVYCIEEKVANYNELKKYSKKKKLEKVLNKIPKLYNMNIFKNNNLENINESIADNLYIKKSILDRYDNKNDSIDNKSNLVIDKEKVYAKRFSVQ